MDHQSFSNFATKYENPFSLHPNDSPALILVSPYLDNKNYHMWSRSMQIALISKNNEKFVDNTFSRLAASYLISACCNTMVLSWVHRSISYSIVKSVVWIILHAVFGRTSELGFHRAIFYASHTFKKNFINSTKVILMYLITLLNRKCFGLNSKTIVPLLVVLAHLHVLVMLLILLSFLERPQ